VKSTRSDLVRLRQQDGKCVSVKLQVGGPREVRCRVAVCLGGGCSVR